MSGRALRKATLSIALGACIASMVPVAMAQTVSGSVVGRANQGDQITITNTDTGLSRSATVDANGNYRIAQLPVGNYTLQATRDGQAVGQAVQVAVSMGSATTVNLGGDGAVKWDQLPVYLIAEFIGAALAAVVYPLIFRTPAEQPGPHAEVDAVSAP